MKDRALIFDIYRGTTHDGPGMRTTVFLKGCPLSCKWCHNPESIAFENQVTYTKRKCIGCRTCNKVSGLNIINVDDGKISLGVTINEIPKICTDNCPTKALAMAAKEYSIDEILSEALKDREYYKSFGGGVTISGGEPTANHEFARELLKRLKAENIHTALDTSGFAKWSVFEELLPFVDAILYDIKLMDSVQHKNLTGVDNALISDNLSKLIEYKKSVKPKLEIWIRTPLIPFASANSTNVEKIGEHLKAVGEKEIDRWELCSFNNTCKSKYEQIGLDWEYKDTSLLSESISAKLLETAQNSFDKDKTLLSGFTSK